MQNSIDRLPDEVLISIVSLLSLKEAGKTSFLARRWRYLWKFSRILYFDGLEMVRKLESKGKLLESEMITFKDRVNKVANWTRRKLLENERTTFVGWVNRVLNLHLSETIEEFRVLFDLDNSNANDIDRWIEFAFTKRVKRLELNMVRSYEHSLVYRQYSFPNICDPTERLRIFPLGQSTCELLISLCLIQVRVVGEVLEFFISKCPLLEEIHVEIADGFESLRPSCRAIRLRHLAIINCRHFRKLEICSPNLVSYTLSTSSRSYITMVLKDVSSLINLSLGEMLVRDLSNYLLCISGCLSKLETLTLQITTMLGHEELEFPYLPRLKKLVLDVNRCHGVSLLCFTHLINAAPLLHEIVLKLSRPRHLMRRRAQRAGQNKHQKDQQKHQCLKVFEIVLVGFDAIAVPVEVARYVLENASSVEKMIVNGMVVMGKSLDMLKEKLASEACGKDIPSSLLMLE